MSNNDELKWMTERYSWRYIPFRYQAGVATIVSALLYFNAFGIVFSDRSTGDCGTFLRPRLEGDGNPRGWFTNSLTGSDTYCSPGYFTGLFWEFLFTFAGLALCGLVMRRAIKREASSSIDGSAPGNTSPGWKDDPFNSYKQRWWNGSSWTDQMQYKPGMEPKGE